MTTTQQRQVRQPSWQSVDSGQLLLVAAAGMLVVAAVAHTAAVGLTQARDAVAFGALIAFGELLRLSLPGDREAAPIGSAGAPGSPLVSRSGLLRRHPTASHSLVAARPPLVALGGAAARSVDPLTTVGQNRSAAMALKPGRNVAGGFAFLV